jgi:hypothetical protein
MWLDYLLLLICIDAVAVYSFARAYLPAARCKPKPFLLPGYILLLIGCGSIFFFYTSHCKIMPATTDRRRRSPRAMAPPMAGPGVRSDSEARRHSKGLWRHFICQSAAAATLQIKGGGAAQGAHPPPGPPDG